MKASNNLISRLNTIKERIFETDDRWVEITQNEREKKEMKNNKNREKMRQTKYFKKFNKISDRFETTDPRNSQDLKQNKCQTHTQSNTLLDILKLV